MAKVWRLPLRHQFEISTTSVNFKRCKARLRRSSLTTSRQASVFWGATRSPAGLSLNRVEVSRVSFPRFASFRNGTRQSFAG